MCDMMRMGWFFIFLSIIMCIVLLGVQVIRVYPIWTEIPKDPWQGEPLNSFQSLIVRGSVTLDVLGQYSMHEVMIYKNGERFLLVEKFPVEVRVLEGDVLEVWVLEGLDGTSVFVACTSGNIDLK